MTEIVAAAARYTRRTAAQKKVDQGWQETAWNFYSNTPEVRFVASWVGNAMSGARLYAARRTEDGTIEEAPDDHPATRLVTSIAGGPDGQSQMLRAFGPHLVVPGEGWIVIQPTDSGEKWHVLSVLEMSSRGKSLEAEIEGDKLTIPAGDDEAPDRDAPIAIRVWEPHPRRHLEADSPVRSSLGLLEELQLLDAAVKAIARSRLVGRGVMLVPKGAKFPSRSGTGDADDDLIEVFMQVAETAYREPESAAATVPIILELPADVIGDVKRLTFESDFDTLAVELRKECITRFATGQDVPAEILLGLGDSNHWSAWALQEEALRLGVEPRLRTFVHALTSQWLQPALQSENVEDAEEWLVWYDTAGLRVRANRAQTALEVFDRGVISPEALRRETGFDDSDAPTEPPAQPDDDNENDDERQEPEDEGSGSPALPAEETTGPPETLASSLLADALQRANTMMLAMAATEARLTGKMPDDVPELLARAGHVLPPEEPATTVLPAGSAPVPDGPDEGLLAAADGLIWYALSRAGEKLRRTPACPRSRRAEAMRINAAALHTLLPVDLQQVEQWGLLEDVWDRTDEIASRYGADGTCLRASLDAYCRELLAAGVEHSFTHVAATVADCLQDAS